MININNLEENSVILCPPSIKKVLIKKINLLNPLLHYKVLNKNEIIENLTFSYSYDSVLYLHKKYKYSLENAEEIIKNLINAPKINDKFLMLDKIYNDLKEQKLLNHNYYFKNFLLNKKIYIYGYSKKDLELIYILKKINIEYEFVEIENKKFKHDVYEFETIEEEVNNLFNNIFSLIENGVSLNNIYIFNYASEYDFLIKKYAYYHKLPIEISSGETLYDSTMYKKFISYLNEFSLEGAYKKIKEEISYDSHDILNKIISCISQISFMNLEINYLIEMLNYLAKKEKLEIIHYENSIKIIDSSCIVGEDDYVFMIGFSLGMYPKIYKDIDFYTDEEKTIINKNTSRINTLIDEDNLMTFLNNTKNVFISYKNKVDKTVFYPSLLIDKLNYRILKIDINNVRYSKVLEEIEVAKLLDMYRLYAKDDKNLYTFSKQELNYMSYDHSFKKISNYKNDKELILSYTQINEYNTCPFQYYLKRVLKLNTFESTLGTNIGNLYHLILQDSLTKAIELNDYTHYIKENFITNKDLFFAYKLLPQIKDVINKNNDFLKITKFKKACSEKEFIVNIDESTKLQGKVDKIMFDEEGKNLIIIDYKTYDFNYDMRKNKYGLDLQLPLYAYLLDKFYPNYTNLGMYIQNVCIDNAENENLDSLYVLNGITLNDEEKVYRLDPLLGTDDNNGDTIAKSLFVNIGINKNNQLKSKNLLDENEFKSLKEEAEQQIIKTIYGIRNGDFNISPVRFKQEKSLGAKSCLYCGFKSICFMKSSDYRDIDLDEEENNEI